MNNNNELRWMKVIIYLIDEAPLARIISLTMFILAVTVFFATPTGTVEYLENQGIIHEIQAIIFLASGFILFIYEKKNWSFFIGTLPLVIYIIATLVSLIAYSLWSPRLILYCLLFYMLNREHYNGH